MLKYLWGLKTLLIRSVNLLVMWIKKSFIMKITNMYKKSNMYSETNYSKYELT